MVRHSISLEVPSQSNAILNSGAIQLAADSNNNLTDLIVGAGGTIALGGGGNVTLSNETNNRIYSNTPNSILDNIDNTISGAGQIFSNGNLSVTNEVGGIINANQTIGLSLSSFNSSTRFSNSGTLEATAAGGLQIISSIIDGSGGGTIQALIAGSHVDLNNATIKAGTLKTGNGGVIQTVTNGNILDGTTGAVNNVGTITISNATNLNLIGTVNNTGAIALSANANNNLTDLIIGVGGTVTLLGGGSVTMSSESNNRIYSNTPNSVLNNLNNTISGSGLIFSNGALSVVNAAGGIINANNLTGLSLANFSNALPFSNSGVLEATNSGGLQIVSSLIDDTSGGVIQALVAGAHVDFNGATIKGGVLSTGNGGSIQTTSNGNTLDGTQGAVTITGTLTVNNATNLGLLGGINNSGTIALSANSNNNLTDLIVGAGSTVTINGGGNITLSNESNNRIYSSTPGSLLDNVSNNISGAGQILSNGDLSVLNEIGGIINANQLSGLALRNFAGSTTFTNKGLLEATASGGLQIDSSVIDGSAGGIIEALNSGAHVDLSSATIKGGTLETVNGGLIQTVNNGSTLDGTTSAVNNIGVLSILNGTSLGLLGTINNTGTIALNANSNNNFTDLIIGTGGIVTLTGSGGVTLTGESNNRIYSNTANSVLDNVNNAISGAGQILSNGDLSVTNEFGATINANQVAGLAIENFTGSSRFVNKGLLEATASGGLQLINSVIDGTSGGTIEALNSTAHVDLNGATIVGGTLTTANSGTIQTIGNGGAIDGTASAVNNTGTVTISNGTSLSLVAGPGQTSTINNAGIIALSANTNNNLTDLIVGGGGTVALHGGGNVTLSNQSNNRIYSNSTNSLLDNFDNKIAGSGQIGVNGVLSVRNEIGGTIDASFAGSTLVLDAASLTNVGTFRAENGGTLQIGNLDAGHVFANLSLDLAHVGGGSLSGGIYDLVDPVGSGTSQIAFTGTSALPITSLNADIVLSGATSILSSGGTALQSSLVYIGSTGALNLYYGFNSGSAANFVDPKSVEDAGSIGLNGANFTAAGIVIDFGASISGSGVLTSSSGSTIQSLTNNGSIVATTPYGPISQALEVSASLAGTGTLEISGNGTLVIDASVQNGAGQSVVSVSAGQTIQFDNNADPGKGETLKIAGAEVDTTIFGAKLIGFGSADTIDLTGIAATSATIDSANILHIYNGAAQVASLQLAPSNAGQGFVVRADGASGSNITTSGTTPPPAPVITAPTNGSTVVNATPAISGTGEAGDLVTVFIDGVTAGPAVTVAATGSWTFTPTTALSNANHSVAATETNAAGVSSALSPADNFTVNTGQIFTDQWVNSTSGAWETAANWSTGAVPGAQDSVLIANAVTVTLSSGANLVASLSTSGNSSLVIAGGSLSITNSSNLGGSLSITGGSLAVNASITANTLSQSGGELNGSGTLTASGQSTFSGGLESGTGTTIALGGAAFTTSSFGLDGGRTLQLGGSSAATGSAVQIDLNGYNPNTGTSDNGSGTLTISNGSTFDDQTTSGLNILASNRGGTDTGTTAAVNNQGTFTKTGSAATSTISTAFNNSGTVNVQSGILDLTGGGNDVGGTYTTTGSGVVEFGGGTHVLDATSKITGNATFSGGQTTINGTYTGTGTMTVSGGTAIFAGAATTGSLVQSNGELNGSGTLTASGQSTFSGGLESGTGTTIALGGAAFTTSSFGLDGGRTLQLGGSSAATGSAVQIDLNGYNPNTGTSDNGSGTLTISNGSTFDDQTTSGLNILASNRGGTDTGTTAAVNNQGTFTKTGSAATSTISTAFNNSGTVNVQSGILDLTGGGNDVGGTYTTTGSGVVEFGGGTHVLDATSKITGNATFSGGQTIINGTYTGTGTMTVSGGTAIFAGAATTGSLVQSNGELNGSGTLTASGQSTFSGGLESGTGTTIALGGAAFTTSSFGLDGGRTLQLGGSSAATGSAVQIDLNGYNPNTGTSDNGSGTLTISNGSTFDDQTTSGLNILASNRGGTDTGTTSAVNNQGTFTKTGSAATSTISTAFNNSGTVNVQSGTLVISGALQNTGTISADGGNIDVQQAVSDTGIGTIYGTSRLEYDLASNEAVTFATGSTGTLLLKNSTLFTGTITGFTGTGAGTPATSDKIDLQDVAAATATIQSYTNNVLTVTDGTHTAHLNFVGTYVLANFHLAPDGSGGTYVVDPPAINQVAGVANQPAPELQTNDEALAAKANPTISPTTIVQSAHTQEAAMPPAVIADVSAGRAEDRSSGTVASPGGNLAAPSVGKDVPISTSILAKLTDHDGLHFADGPAIRALDSANDHGRFEFDHNPNDYQAIVAALSESDLMHGHADWVDSHAMVPKTLTDIAADHLKMGGLHAI